MNNQRINILRDELQQRCDEIVSFTFPKNDPWNLDHGKKDEFLQLVAEYVYFILITPELQPHFAKLIKWHQFRMESKEVKRDLEQVAVIIQQLGSTLSTYTSNLSLVDFKGREWKNPFNRFGTVSPVELLNLLNENHTYVEPIETIETLSRVLAGDELPENGILFYMKQFETNINKKVKPFFEKLNILLGKLKTALVFETSFVGYNEAHELLQAFRFKYPDWTILNVDDKVSELIKYDALREEDVICIKNASKKIYKILSRILSAGQLKGYTIFRLKAYMEWFYSVKRTNDKKWEENQLTEEMAKFLFAQGFFPFIRFKVGRGEPDMVALSQHEEIIIEAKNYLTPKGETPKKLTSDKIETHISQAIQYYEKLRSWKQELDNQVYLVVFYDGDFYPICKESITRNGVVVNIVFIYLGNKTPHEKRKDLNLEIDNSTENAIESKL